jgi:hypothetical protein
MRFADTLKWQLHCDGAMKVRKAGTSIRILLGAGPRTTRHRDVKSPPDNLAYMYGKLSEAIGILIANHGDVRNRPFWTDEVLVRRWLVGCCWVPVVWLQMRMRDLAMEAAAKGSALPAEYRRYYRWWLGLGWPAFVGVLVIFYLMVAKPRM